LHGAKIQGNPALRLKKKKAKAASRCKNLLSFDDRHSVKSLRCRIPSVKQQRKTSGPQHCQFSI
jgi:hypothetical protein